jgi:hypothetical protein
MEKIWGHNTNLSKTSNNKQVLCNPMRYDDSIEKSLTVILCHKRQRH